MEGGRWGREEEKKIKQEQRSWGRDEWDVIEARCHGAMDICLCLASKLPSLFEDPASIIIIVVIVFIIIIIVICIMKTEQIWQRISSLPCS